MLFGLSRAGIGDIGLDEQLIQFASQYGFQAIDGDPVDFVGRLGVEGAMEYLQEHGIAWASFGLPVEWRASDEVFRAGLAQLAKTAEIASAIGCKSCCTYILPSTDELPAAFMSRATKRLRICAQILGAYGIRLGLEYVGPHHLRTTWKYPFIWTQEDTLSLIDAIGEPNVGLLLDAYHWYTTELSYEAISSLQPHQIVHVHLNDAPDVPIDQVIDNERLYPGEGAIDLAGFLRALAATGYQGAITQEILTKEPLQETAEKLLLRSQAGWNKVLAQAGFPTLSQ